MKKSVVEADFHDVFSAGFGLKSNTVTRYKELAGDYVLATILRAEFNRSAWGLHGIEIGYYIKNIGGSEFDSCPAYYRCHARLDHYLLIGNSRFSASNQEIRNLLDDNFEMNRTDRRDRLSELYNNVFKVWADSPISPKSIVINLNCNSLTECHYKHNLSKRLADCFPGI